jgi:glycosyltransferase involved in cell wall biosynthesis
LYGYNAIRLAKKLPRPDVVSAQDPFETGLAAYVIARHFRVPLVVEVHTDFLSPQYAAHSMLNQLRLKIARFVLPRATGGYTVSRRLADAISARYRLRRQFDVLPVYVDVGRFSMLPRTPQQGSLLWVGRFEPEKRPLLALEAVAEAQTAGNAVRLTMLGEGSMRAEMHEFIRNHSMGNTVTLPGWGDPADYLPTTELMLSTSAYEGYGMALVEALAAGVPVLSTGVGVAQDAGAVIAATPFPEALSAWLSGPRNRGTLLLPTYASMDGYLNCIYDFYASFI